MATKNQAALPTNRALWIIVCVLAVVLVALLIVSIQLVRSSPDTQPDTLSTSESTAPSTEPTSIPTTPTSIPTTPATRPTAPGLPVTPSGGKYTNVGSGYIAEVIRSSIETFDGGKTDDYSRPTNNYLPEGTLDYYTEDGKYAQLRSGHRVYIQKKNYPMAQYPYSVYEPEIERYEGTLPDHNEIEVVSMEIEGHHTILTLDCLWKAPFYFDLAPQNYSYPNGGSDRDYAVSSCTVSYVDITFCYATGFYGEISIPDNHPLFKSAELIQNESDYTLRLHLRKTGGFYGWHAYYNDQDQLCFKFLNPVKVTAANNLYGADLTGVTVLIDVGHGGVDGGAVGTNAEGESWDEAQLNLMLALALKKELESVGATVVLNRTGDTRIDINSRLEHVQQTAADICIAIHQDSIDGYPNVNGFSSMYYTPYSQLLAKKIYEQTDKTDVYDRTVLKWYQGYFVTRETICPMVLTENGFVTNAKDLENMTNLEMVQIKAQAMAEGIAKYFLAIQ